MRPAGSGITRAPRCAGCPKLATGLELVAAIVLVMLISLVIRIPDTDDIDG